MRIASTEHARPAPATPASLGPAGWAPETVTAVHARRRDGKFAGGWDAFRGVEELGNGQALTPVQVATLGALEWPVGEPNRSHVHPVPQRATARRVLHHVELAAIENGRQWSGNEDDPRICHRLPLSGRDHTRNTRALFGCAEIVLRVPHRERMRGCDDCCERNE